MRYLKFSKHKDRLEPEAVKDTQTLSELKAKLSEEGLTIEEARLMSRLVEKLEIPERDAVDFGMHYGENRHFGE